MAEKKSKKESSKELPDGDGMVDGLWEMKCL